MPKITITSTTNSIRADFGDYSTDMDRLKGVWQKAKLSFVLKPTFIEVEVDGQDEIDISNVETDFIYQIDLVDGVAPTSLADLYDKLQALVS